MQNAIVNEITNMMYHDMGPYFTVTNEIQNAICLMLKLVTNVMLLVLSFSVS